ncbi:hypothetical protein [Segeticoccus sp.]|nr:hypothetical protein [Segeticoccus sp.]
MSERTREAALTTGPAATALEAIRDAGGGRKVAKWRWVMTLRTD